MIENELRIGNFVIEETIGYSGLKKKEIEVKVRNLLYTQNLQPIPLTEEWLIKFGFAFQKDLCLYYKKCGEISHEIELYESGAIEFHPFGNESFVYIKYVHQLQNIYFALTGTELELKTK